MRKVLLIGLLVVLLVSIVSDSVEARTRYDIIYRGQTRGWFLDPGDVLVVYYIPDGSFATVAWKNNWYYWLKNNPYSTINIYCAPGWSGSWYWMYVDSLSPWYRSLALWLADPRAAYAFVIKNYRNGDIVYLRTY